MRVHRPVAYSLVAWVVACAAVLFVVVQPPVASGIAANNKHTVVATPAAAGQYSSYSIGPYDVANNETITKVAITFPAQCNVSLAQPGTAGDTVSVSGQTVTVTFGTPKAAGSRFTVYIANIRNPVSPGTYSISSPVVFTRSTGVTVNAALVGKRSQFTILVSPYMVLSIETPDDTQTVDFGFVDPGVTAASQTVTVTVDSSVNYLITRTVSGQTGLMGLTVGTLPGTVQTAGVATFTNDYTITPPWTTDPGIPLSASVVYTVTQQ